MRPEHDVLSHEVKHFSKNSNFGILQKLNMRLPFRSSLIRCVNLKWTWLVLWEIQSGHDLVYRETDGQTDGRTDGICNILSYQTAKSLMTARKPKPCLTHTRSISYPAMAWRRHEPRHHPSWYRCSLKNIHRSHKSSDSEFLIAALRLKQSTILTKITQFWAIVFIQKILTPLIQIDSSPPANLQH